MINFIINCMAIAIGSAIGWIIIAAIVFMMCVCWDGLTLLKNKLKRDIESKYEKPWDH